jgi:hypothetical protein
MPSLINQSVGLDPNGNPVYVGANYRQQIVPFSRFGTRKIAWYKIGSADLANGGGVLDMESFNKVIDTIQSRMEIVTIGAPYIVNDTGWNKFMVAVFEDTANNGDSTELSGEGEVGFNPGSTTLQNALQAALDDNSIYVERFYLYGAPGGGTDDDLGWSVNSAYAEPDLKRDFLNGYTQD